VFATFPATPAAAFNMTVSADNTWLATARARAGYATGPVLWYVTGGAAWTKTSYSASASGLVSPGINTLGQFATTSFGDTKTGFVVGGGVEWMFAPNWIVRAEYLYHQFSGSSSVMALQGVAAGGGNTCVGGGGAAQCNWAINTSDLHLNVVRAGLAYKF
jgi:outer membrane immunogenic protein